MDTVKSKLEYLKKNMLKDLQSNILPFWLKYGIDQNGGLYGEARRDGTPVPASNLSLVLCARVVWTFSAAYRIFKKPEYIEMAKCAYITLTKRFVDEKHGGLYWSVSPDGIPSDTAKITYGQGFALYAFTEYYRASGSEESLKYADDVFEVITRKLRLKNGYIESTAADFSLAERGGNYIGKTGLFSMNTHLHILEPVTNYMRIRPERAEAALAELIGIFTDKIYDSDKGHFNQYFDYDFKPISKDFSYGHDIEGSWLIYEAAQTLLEYGKDKKAAEKILDNAAKVSLKMAQAEDSIAVDPDGGILDEGTPEGVIIRNGKVWWSQAEGVVGFLNAWQLSGEEKYLDRALEVWNFIDKNIIDHEFGEWFNSADEGSRNRSKIHAWKCPYHNGRAAMEIFERIN